MEIFYICIGSIIDFDLNEIFSNTGMRLKLLLLSQLLAIILTPGKAYNQPIVDFTLPDSSCVGELITINNLTTGGSTYYWSFCSGNAISTPIGTNIGNPGGNLAHPTYITLAKDNSDCFSFVSDQGSPSHVTRYYHGTSFHNNPISWTSILTGGTVSIFVEGIQIKNDNGQWYGFLCNNTTILRLNFGSTLWNTPTFTDIGPFPPIAVAHGLQIIKEGNTWIGFFDSDTEEKLYRLNFGTSLANIPAFEDLGNVGSFNHPCQIVLQQENGNWYILVVNLDNATLSRITFGNSLLNTPSGTNLGNLGGLVSPVGLTYLLDCESSTGFFTVYHTNGEIGGLYFTGGIGGTVTAQVLGNIGNLVYPHSFSELFRENDSLFAYLTNRDANTLTRLAFPPCSNASIPSSNLFNPPTFFYNQPGTYNVRLLVNEGLPNQTSLCKNIVIEPVPTVNLGADRTICPGQSTVLDAGPGFTTYLWSTGATTRTITVNSAGTYSVAVTHSGCSASDAVNISVYNVNPVDIGPDVSIYEGETYTFDAGACAGCSYLWGEITSGQPNLGTGPTYTTGIAGTYTIRKTDANGCITYDTAILTVNPLPQLTVDFLAPDSSCVGQMINVTNLSTGGLTYYWTFCSGNANSNPSGVNIGNPFTLLNTPTYLTLVKDGNDCFTFISCQGPGIIRYYNGSSFANLPSSGTQLGTFGLLANNEGIQIKNDNGNWYGFVCNNTTLIRLNFGNSLWNVPSAFDLGPFSGLNMLHGLVIIKEGNTWLGFATCSIGDKLVRFNFGNSLSNIPTLVDFGNFGVMTGPGAICIIKENSTWYGLIMDTGNKLIRLNFGASLLNAPTAENLGTPGGMTAGGGLTIIRDCENTSGYFTNYLINGTLGKLTFDGGIGGTVTGQNLGNIGNLNRPHSFSEIFRQNDTLFAYISNRGSNTLTKLTFPPCSNASIPSSTLFTPPPFSYNSAGIYNIQLIVNEGLPNQESLCKDIVISPVPTVDLGIDRNICPGQSTVLDAGPGFTTYSWSTGATTRTITVNSGGTYSVTVTHSGCSASDAVNVNVYTVNPVNAGNDTTICQGGVASLNAGACPGCSFLWSDLTHGIPSVGTGQVLVTGIAALYKVTVTDINGCTDSDTVEVFVGTNPNVINDPLSDTICSGTQLNILLLSDVPGATFFWTASLVTGTATGFNSGNGTVISDPLANTGTGMAVIKYTITATIGGCSGPSVDYLVTIHPQALVNISPATTVLCSGDTTGIILSSPVPGTVFSWTATCSQGFISGYSNGSGTTISQILISSGNVDGTVIYHITPSVNGCQGAVVDYPVIVRPVPVVSFLPPATTICSGSPFMILLQSQVPGSNFTWTASGSSGMVSGYSGGSGSSISQPLINLGFNVESVTYHVTASSNGCTAQPVDYTVIVNPIPDLSFVPVATTLCTGSQTNISLSSQVTGATFSWTASGSSGFITGYANGSDSVIAQTLFNSGPDPGTVTYQVTAAANGCAGMTLDYIVTVLPGPVVNFSPPTTTLCSGDTTGITLSSTTAGTTFSWTATGSSGLVTGFSDGTGSFISQVLYNNSFTSQFVTYHVIPESTGCNGNPVDYSVTVSPLPNVIFTPATQSICSGQKTAISLTSGVAGTTFTWNASSTSPGVTGFSPGTGDSIIQTLINTDFTTGTVTYAVTGSANGCQQGPSFAYVDVKPSPIVSLALCNDTVTLTGAKPFVLRGGIPPGGIYSGTGVNSPTGIFYPALAGPGTKVITYSFINSFGCSASSLSTIRVVNAAPFTCGNTLTDIRDGKAYKTILIGSQCWMAANLNYGSQIAGTVSQRDNCINEKYCQNDQPGKCMQAGAMYQWDEMMQYDQTISNQGLCPPAWHVPTETEWNTLFANWTNSGFAGSPLKHSGYSGFNALMAGTRLFNKSWSYSGWATFLWSSTPWGPTKAWAHAMNDYDPSVALYPSSRANAFSVRCLKD